jgi:hypothetical protein
MDRQLSRYLVAAFKQVLPLTVEVYLPDIRALREEHTALIFAAAPDQHPVPVGDAHAHMPEYSLDQTLLCQDTAREGYLLPQFL